MNDFKELIQLRRSHRKFTDEEIEKMEGQKALNFWHKYKDFILACPNERFIEEN